MGKIRVCLRESREDIMVEWIELPVPGDDPIVIPVCASTMSLTDVLRLARLDNVEVVEWRV
jgi:hypothetical protein